MKPECRSVFSFDKGINSGGGGTVKRVEKFLKKCFSKGFTFMIVPSSGGAIKSWGIPFSLVLVICGIIIFNVYVFVGFTTQIWRIYHYKQEIYQKDQKISKLLKEQQEIRPTLERSREIVAELTKLKQERSQLINKFNTLQQKVPQRGINSRTSITSRGSSVRTQPYIIPPREEKTNILNTDLEMLKHNLNYLDVFLEEEGKDQIDLSKDVLAFEDLIDHTPTIGPIGNSRIISWFGRRFHPVYKTYKNHDGVDIEASYGSKIYATADGIVTYSGWEGGYGLLVKINHGYGYETRYGHNSKNLVKVGQRIKKGQLIGYSGKSGVVTGPHLHYEVRVNGKPVDPRPYVNN